MINIELIENNKGGHDDLKFEMPGLNIGERLDSYLPTQSHSKEDSEIRRRLFHCITNSFLNFNSPLHVRE